MKKKDIIKNLKLGIASPERIKEWSYGEVTKAETINYKSLKPERDGLFDEVIFGPTKDYECACGKFKKIKFKGIKCDKCNVEITESIVRRERMGHIQLETPIAHIWMTKELPNPSKISLLLDISYKEVEQVVYFINHIVLEEGHYTYDNKPIFKHKEVVDIANPKNSQKTRTKLRRILKDIANQIKNDPKKGRDDFDYQRARTYDEILAEKNLPFSIKEVFTFITKYTGIKFGIGAVAIQSLLKELDLNKEMEKIIFELKQYDNPNDINVKKLLRRLEVVKWIKESGNKPEWMILDCIPVTPPDTRPIIQLDGGRFTTSDINSFYRKIIIRNERLKNIKKSFAPSILIDNECRMLQEAVDSLFDNQSRKKPVLSRDKRVLKSLSSHLKGKQGLFRQNLLGKRVDYSGRSVIVVGPELKMYEVGIPAIMILKLFRPFIIKELISKKDENGLEKQPLATTIKQAETMILEQHSSIWPIIQEIAKERPILLNRAPTLHRLGIQAFNVKIADGKAIRLHPLVTTAFNADFDGDQMAVHVPLSKEAVAEARSIMLASRNILGPKDGKPIVAPTQDIVLGNYFLTKEEPNQIGERTIFTSVNEVMLALANKAVNLHSIIGIVTSAYPKKTFSIKKGILITTPGKVILNTALPEDFEYINRVEGGDFTLEKDLIHYNENIKDFIRNREISLPFGKKNLGLIVDKLYSKYSQEISVVPSTLDKIKELGFKYSTISATSISLFDVPEYDKKNEYFKEADKKVIELQNFKEKGWLTEDERYLKTVQLWSNVKDQVTKDIEEIVKKDANKNNSIIVMAQSEARGNISNFTQLAGMRGLMSKSFNYDQKQKSKIIKDTIEIPIKHSFVEGLSISEYFNSTYGARKGLTDTAMKTSKSGYMTRKLVDATQEVIIYEHDCKTTNGLEVSEIVNTLDQIVIEPLYDRIVGRYTIQDVYDKNNNLVLSKNQLITKEKAKEIASLGIKSVLVRSAMHCQSIKGICQKCFGLDLSTNSEIKIGTAIGVIAAQSIGEPGTQLTMRTFHTGGVSGETNITQGFERLKQLFELIPPKKHEKAIISEVEGRVTSINDNGFEKTIIIDSKKESTSVVVPSSSKLRVYKGDEVKLGSKITEGSINIDELLNIAGINVVRNYLIKEVQKVYRLQGIEISDKYIEIIVNQLTNKAVVVNPGDSEYFVGQIVNINKFKQECQKLIKKGKNPPIIISRAYGLESIPSKSDSFLSAASFQDTKKVLIDAASKAQIDELFGLKENVIIGKLIPAGTGIMTKEEILSQGEMMITKEY